MALDTRLKIQNAIDRLPRTSGVNGVKLGGTVQLAPGEIKLDKPLLIYSGTQLVGDGCGTVLLGALSIETHADHHSAEAIVIANMQITGGITRGKTADNECDNIQFRDLEIWGGNIDLSGKAINRPSFERVSFHGWTGTTITGNFRMARFIACKWLSEDVDVNTYPLIDLIGDQCSARFESCWLQPRGMGIKAIGGGVSITLANTHIEPLRPKAEIAQQRTTLPRMEIGTGTVIADRLDGMDVSPIILHGTTLRCDDQRAIDQWGGPIDASLAFVKTQN